ncbi:unnamed protein product [Caenorhabditis auriculariae]|uniref:Uncharacterized protein n=1 Tax=Caenorhabditis auriculariae TaxID=2777116 RepID=A0A8S1HNP6_9PELO|nr:unnamed protein product [Caenorhabditis auriculariae]
MRYYISRYQVWMSGCKGKMKSASHTSSPTSSTSTFQPAAFFCVLKEIRRRTAHPIKLNSKLYASLPQVELNRGVPFSKLSHPLWLF